MPLQTVTLQIPDVLYSRLKQRAERARRSVEAELMEVLVTAVPVAEELPADLSEAVSPLSVLEDEDLWQAARSRLPAEEVDRLEEHHLKRQPEGLMEAEERILADLVRRYERF